MDKLRKLQAEKEKEEREAKLQAEKEEREAKLHAEKEEREAKLHAEKEEREAKLQAEKELKMEEMRTQLELARIQAQAIPVISETASAMEHCMAVDAPVPRLFRRCDVGPKILSICAVIWSIPCFLDVSYSDEDDNCYLLKLPDRQSLPGLVRLYFLIAADVACIVFFFTLQSRYDVGPKMYCQADHFLTLTQHHQQQTCFKD
ncbi:hypothetical protein EGW08_020630 [Elysia chlorotica]|uniref:Uncharacterized protein n=1 Tax=Elysia chlorotica TaxID=188477 RepID=A0A3S0Z6A4_ELYCH|nr:hypothetical protein EGW08_020630 [Elysia chlorotica]